MDIGTSGGVPLLRFLAPKAPCSARENTFISVRKRRLRKSCFFRKKIKNLKNEHKKKRCSKNRRLTRVLRRNVFVLLLCSRLEEVSEVNSKREIAQARAGRMADKTKCENVGTKGAL